MTATDVVIREPDQGTLPAENAGLVAQAQAIVVRDDASYIDAAETAKRLKAARGLVAELYADVVAAAHDLHKKLCAKRNALDTPLEAAQKALARQCGEYTAAKEREAEQARRAAEAEARKREEERRLAEAAELERQGRRDEAEAVIDREIITPSVRIDPTVPKVSGVRKTTTWRAEVYDLTMVPRKYMVPDQKQLDAIARATKGPSPIPGVRFTPVESSAIY